MLRQLEGSAAVAETVARCRPEVVCAYPISPQTHIVEGLSDLVRSGELAPCEYMTVESEFAALSVCIGASATGARTYTATASQGLLYMAEALYNASGLGLPIVMTVANRALGAPINIWNDHRLAGFETLNAWYYSDAPRAEQPRLEAARRASGFEEVVGGLEEENALFEARRCLSCGNCFSCDNCYGVCPDNAVIKLGAPGERYEIDLDYCKGCGISATECPCGAIEMVPEPG